MKRSKRTCEIGGCSASSELCQYCRHWRPSPNSKYYSCIQFIEDRKLCDVEGSPCETCRFHEPDDDVVKGRPNFSGINWNDPRDVADYRRAYMRLYRAGLRATFAVCDTRTDTPVHKNLTFAEARDKLGAIKIIADDSQFYFVKDLK